MNLFSPAEITQSYSDTGVKKTSKSAGLLLVLSILAGMIVAFAAVATNTVVHNNPDTAMVRLITGLLFPFCLGIIMLVGAELFTGNTMIVISVLNKQVTIPRMLRNWCLVYAGNFIGSLMVAAMIYGSGQLSYSYGLLGAYTIKVAAAKCALPFGNAFFMGVMCNILVCAGVLCSYSAKDTIGRLFGAYIPVVLFVLAGYEHSVANMYYINAGLMALMNPAYADMAAGMGVDLSSLTVSGFLIGNLIPVTLGNISGGCAMGIVMWFSNKTKKH